MEQDIKTQLLTKRPIDLLFQLSVPAVIGMTVIGLYPLMDGVFAGNIIGQTAMTACGVATTLTIFNNGVSTLVGIGSASVLSRALGKGDQKTVDKIMGNLIFWVILFSVIITVGGILLAPHFLSMVGATGEIKAYGIRYLRIVFLGSLFVNFTQSANMIMRGEGLMKKTMIIMDQVFQGLQALAAGAHRHEGDGGPGQDPGEQARGDAGRRDGDQPPPGRDGAAQGPQVLPGGVEHRPVAARQRRPVHGIREIGRAHV